VIPLPAIRLITAPSDARVASVAVVGSVVAPGDVVAVLDVARGTFPLVAPVHGTVGGALTAQAQSVASGDAVVWIRP
jgi:biotin carboxyl carrier protein